MELDPTELGLAELAIQQRNHAERERDELRALLKAQQQISQGLHEARRRVERDLADARARGATLEAAGQYLADVLRAGSTGNHTASQLSALERWKAALDAVPAAETGSDPRRTTDCTCSGTENPPLPAEMDPSCPLHGVAGDVTGPTPAQEAAFIELVQLGQEIERETGSGEA